MPVVDVEQLLTNFLRTQTEVTDVVADRVYTDLPHERVYPMVLIQRIGGAHLINRPLWLDEALVQFDVYGGTHKQAFALMSACLSALAERGIKAHPEGCVTGVTSDSIAYNPEPDFVDDVGHTRPRFTTTVSVLTHP